MTSEDYEELEKLAQEIVDDYDTWSLDNNDNLLLETKGIHYGTAA